MKKILILIFFCPFIVFSQSRVELEQQRNAAEEQIKYTNNLIITTEKSKKSSYNKILLINSKISNRKQIIASIETELNILNDSILQKEHYIADLEYQLDSLRKNYATIIYYSYLSRNTNDKLMFILASENFNVAYKRIKYYLQYTQYRKKQVEEINRFKIRLLSEISQMKLLYEEKSNLLNERRFENEKLINEKNQKDREVKLLASKEKELRQKLKAQYDLSARLKREIEKIIAEETKKAAELLKKKSTGVFQLTPEELLLAEIFSKNQNKLPWPTVHGSVTGFFGEQPHPFLSGIKIRNDGIDISTNEGEKVRSVYDGVISRIFVIPGAHKTVIIRHGNFLTVYSNLREVSVNQGDKVKAKQEIGTIYTELDNDHKTVLQFQIWKENEKLNPLEWLAK